MIRNTSDFFDKALSSEWKESEDRSVSLPDTEPETFELYLHWLYVGNLPVKSKEPGHIGNQEYLQLAKAYVLGDHLQDAQFDDVVIDAMIDKSASRAADGNKWYPTGPVIACIYNNTPETSQARRLLMDFFVNFGNGDWLHVWSKQEDLPKEFLLDLATTLLEKRPRAEKSIKDKAEPCKYHCHGVKRQCYMDHSNRAGESTTKKLT